MCFMFSMKLHQSSHRMGPHYPRNDTFPKMVSHTILDAEKWRHVRVGGDGNQKFNLKEWVPILLNKPRNDFPWHTHAKYEGSIEWFVVGWTYWQSRGEKREKCHFEGSGAPFSEVYSLMKFHRQNKAHLQSLQSFEVTKNDSKILGGGKEGKSQFRGCSGDRFSKKPLDEYFREVACQIWGSFDDENFVSIVITIRGVTGRKGNRKN